MAKDKKNKKTDIPATAPRMSIPGTGIPTQASSGQNPSATMSGQDLSSMSPELMQQLQLEEAIKESQNPSLKLKKLKSPLSIKSCFLNLLIFIFLTIVVVFVIISFYVDNFNLWLITKDIFGKFGITQFFSNLFRRIANLFTGKGWTLDSLTMWIR